MWLHGQARHFSGDLYLVEWLESQGIEYDVATDEDLHVIGSDLLDGYAVVLTGGHPEYWTFEMLETLEGYLSGTGKLMYLGGNGFYWVTGMDAARPHLLEVRRGVSGIRAWTSHPGEVTLSLTGEQGGLWRYRGKAPNSLCGVGFASEGWGGAPGYVQTAGRFDERAAFIVDGIDPDEVIGNFGFVMGGAAGDEIDRIDYALGSPEETIRIATTEMRHSDYYQLVVEDCSFVLPGLGGTQEPRVRSDIAYVEDINGGAVFSAGSINWIGSLMWNGGENNVSRMTANVVRRFAGLA
jgi:N,N-dimethylformamidase